MERLCNGNDFGFIGIMMVFGVMIVLTVAASTINECDAPVCMFDSYEFINWFMTYLFLLIGSIALSWSFGRHVKTAEYNGFFMFFVCVGIILCVILPIMHGNVAECDAPLCYLGGPQNDDISEIYYNNAHNWYMFYIVLGFQIFFGWIGIIALAEIMKKETKHLQLFLASTLVVMFCVMPVLLNNNFGECDVFICYGGAPAPAGNMIPAETITDNNNKNLHIFYVMTLFQSVLLLFLLMSICSWRKNITHS